MERLKALKLQSTQIRGERYKILYLWKVASGLGPNFGLDWNQEKRRRGRRFLIGKCKGDCLKYRTLKENSLGIEGERLFNRLLRVIRNFDGTLTNFKGILDKFLEQIPNEPYMGGTMVKSALNLNVKPSNSIRDWIHTLRTFSSETEEDVIKEDEAEEVCQ